jgi:hypothetical protein
MLIFEDQSKYLISRPGVLSKKAKEIKKVLFYARIISWEPTGGR